MARAVAGPGVWLGLLGLGLGLGGCADLWGQSSTPNPDNCVRSGCPDGLVCDAERQICVPFEPSAELDLPSPTPDLASSGAAPVSYVFPDYPTLDPMPIPLALAFQVATWESSTMHYTLGGSEPIPGNTGTTSGPSPLKTRNFGGGTLSWRAESSSGVFESVRRRLVTMTASPVDLGMQAYDMRFTGSGGPLLAVSPGARVQGQLAWRGWRSTPSGYCPGCILQMVMSVESVGVPTGGCAENIQNLGEFPGGTGELNFDFTAPEGTGEYIVRAGLTLQFFCDGTPPQSPIVVGRLRVR